MEVEDFKVTFEGESAFWYEKILWLAPWVKGKGRVIGRLPDGRTKYCQGYSVEYIPEFKLTVSGIIE